MKLFNYIDYLHERSAEYVWAIMFIDFKDELKAKQGLYGVYFEKNKYPELEILEAYTTTRWQHPPSEYMSYAYYTIRLGDKVVSEDSKTQNILNKIIKKELIQNTNIEYKEHISSIKLLTTSVISKDALYYQLSTSSDAGVVQIIFCYTWVLQLLCLGAYSIEQYKQDILKFDLLPSLVAYMDYYNLPHPTRTGVRLANIRNESVMRGFLTTDEIEEIARIMQEDNFYIQVRKKLIEMEMHVDSLSNIETSTSHATGIYNHMKFLQRYLVEGGR